MKRFNSKMDRWLLIILIISLVMDLAGIVVVVATVREPLVLTLVVLALLLTAVLIAWIMLDTYYVVERGTLRIVSGPLRFRIKLDDINSVKATRNPLSSPALSLDRLLVNYGNNRKVMVSPKDKRNFLKAIGQELGE